ncbi:MAG: hypothetical protein AAF564_10945 [Bacteroidota bacterium]
MRQNPFVRWQLWVLGGITLLLMFRVLSGPPPRSGLVVMERMHAESLVQKAFEVERAIEVSVEGQGSFQFAETGDKDLAAYAWIIDAETREPVWQMDQNNTVRSKGSLATVSDELRLKAGTYHLIFASYGNVLDGRLNRDQREESDWEDDERDWYVVLNLVDGKETDVHHKHVDAQDAPVFNGERLVWHSGPVKNKAKRSYLFDVTAPTTFTVRATGEFSEDVNDYGYIVNELSGERVWEMKHDNTMPAGGVAENRMVSAKLDLNPGVYRIAYNSDATHAYDGWKGNPPYNPAGWGISLTTDENSQPVLAFDPWTTRQPMLSMLSNTDDALKVATFRVHQKQRFVLYGLGEMKRNDRYDYGWIERMPANTAGVDAYFIEDVEDRHPDSDRSVWEMTYEASQPAGGDDSNRRSVSFVDLVPDLYTLYYRTDGSHSFSEWSNGEPAESERWGVAMFDLDGMGDIDIVEQLDLAAHFHEGEHEERIEEELAIQLEGLEEIEAQVATAVEAAVEAAVSAELAYVAPAEPAAPLPPSALFFEPSDVLISMNKLGNDVDRYETLELQGWARLRVVAVGEITPSGNQYDYGYITKASTGEKVWEMKLDNTEAAGGDEANRIFDGTVELSAGTYRVHFKTDATHSFGGFNTPQPALPDAWGITIARDR